MLIKYVVIFAFLFSVAFGQQHTINVFDAWSLKVIPSCTILFGEKILLTDKNGQSTFDRNSADSIIFIERHDYFSAKINITDRRTINVYLQPVEQSDIVSVSAERSPFLPSFLPAGTSHISVEDNTANIQNSIEKLLAKETAITMKSYGGQGQISNIALRGLSADQTQVLYDGIPVNSLQLGGADFSLHNLSTIGSIDIYRGGSPLFGGTGAIGGTINFLPPQIANTFKVDLSHSLSSLENRNSILNIHLPADFLKQHFSANFGDGKNSYNTRSDGKNVALKNRDFSSRNLFWHGRINVSENLLTDLILSNYNFDGGAPEPFTGEAAESENIARRKDDNTFVRLRVDQKIKETEIVYQAFVRNDWNSYIDPNLDQKSIHFNQESGLYFRSRYFFTKNLLINAGIESAWQKIRSSDSGLHKRNRYAAFALGDWIFYENPANDFNAALNVSSRYENVGGEDIFLPGAGINIAYSYFDFYGSVGKNHRVPTFNQLYWPVWGNPDLEPESSINYETGLLYKQNINNLIIDLGLGVFFTHVDNQIKWVQQGNQWNPLNIAAVESKGLEFHGGLSPQNELYKFSFNYTYTDVRKVKKEFDADQTIGNRIPYIPLHSLSVGISAKWAGLSGGLNTQYMSFRYKSLTNDPDEFLPSQITFSIWLNQEFSISEHLKADLNFMIENLTDEAYEMVAGYPMPPRVYSLYVSLNY